MLVIIVIIAVHRGLSLSRILSYKPFSRNLYDLSHEIQDQLLILEKEDTRKNKRLHHMATIVAEWEQYFGSPYTVCRV